MTKQKNMQNIGKILGRLGIQKVQSMPAFWKALERDHKDVIDEFESALEERTMGQEAPVHEIKNSSLEFANKIFSQFDSDRTREFFGWLVREDLLSSGNKVLELGCDNGVFLCVCAVLFPDIEFQGLDINSDAIDIARKRKDQLGLRNVVFDKLPSDGWESLPEQTFDFVFTQTVMHEVLNEKAVSVMGDIGQIDTSGFEFTPDRVELSISPNRFDYLKCVRTALKNSGSYISLERVSTHHAFHLWHHALAEADLQIDYARSYKLSFKNHEKDVETMPVTVARREGVVQSPNWSDDLSFWIYDDFMKKKDLVSIDDPGIAEAMYLALDRKLAATIRLVWDNTSGTMQKIFGSAGSLCFSYTTTDQDFRSLVLVPSVCMHEIVQNEAAAIHQMLPHVLASVTVQDEALVARLDLGELVKSLQSDLSGNLPGSNI